MVIVWQVTQVHWIIFRFHLSSCDKLIRLVKVCLWFCPQGTQTESTGQVTDLSLFNVYLRKHNLNTKKKKKKRHHLQKQVRHPYKPSSTKIVVTAIILSVCHQPLRCSKWTAAWCLFWYQWLVSSNNWYQIKYQHAQCLASVMS